MRFNVVDLTKLTQEQMWGLEFVVSQRNAEIKAKNDAIPKGSEQEPTALFTRSSYLETILKSACDSYYQQCLEYKEKTNLELAKQLPPETIQALLQQFGGKDAIDYTLIPEE